MPTTGQLMWPGDVNGNGIVNGIDVLYCGIAYGRTGAARPGGNSTWSAQSLGPLWTEYFSDGVNYAYADGDGNGEIDENDISQVIEDNFLLTHGTIIPDEYSNDNMGAAPRVKLLPQNANVGLGQLLKFDLWLGESELPVQNFYGIALELSYNADFTLGSEWEYEETDNVWIDPTDDNSESLFYANEALGKLQLVITRTNQQAISGAGKIGAFSIIIEDIIVGLQMDTLNFQIDRIRLIDENFSTLSVVPDSTFVVVTRPDGTQFEHNNQNIEVFPNPTGDVIFVKSTLPIDGYELMDLSGRRILMSNIPKEENELIKISLNSNLLKKQVYFLKILTREGVFVRKVVVR